MIILYKICAIAATSALFTFCFLKCIEAIKTQNAFSFISSLLSTLLAGWLYTIVFIIILNN